MAMELGDRVVWLDYSGVSDFATYIRGVSPCGRLALIDRVNYPVRVGRLQPLENEDKMLCYNHWMPNDVDVLTKKSLMPYLLEIIAAEQFTERLYYSRSQ